MIGGSITGVFGPRRKPPVLTGARVESPVSASLTESLSMNEETFNLQIRRFLKKVGVTSQREIEKAVRDAVATGALSGDEKVRASVTLKLPDLGIELDIDDTIALD